jgi:hypothetical protein
MFLLHEGGCFHKTKQSVKHVVFLNQLIIGLNLVSSFSLYLDEKTREYLLENFDTQDSLLRAGAAMYVHTYKGLLFITLSAELNPKGTSQSRTLLSYSRW